MLSKERRTRWVKYLGGQCAAGTGASRIGDLRHYGGTKCADYCLDGDHLHPAGYDLYIRPTQPVFLRTDPADRRVCHQSDSLQIGEGCGFCGVRSGAQVDKFAQCGLHPLPAQRISAPILEECPVALECRVTESRLLGTHELFLAEILGVDVDEQYLDSKGGLNLQQCGLAAYAHGEYFALGRKLGDFGFSVRKRKRSSDRMSK